MGYNPSVMPPPRKSEPFAHVEGHANSVVGLSLRHPRAALAAEPIIVSRLAEAD